MDWLSVGLLSTALFACVGVIDKVVISRYFRNAWSYPFFTSCFLALYSLLLLSARLGLGRFHSPGATVTALALIPGIAHFTAAILYTRALLDADAATVFGLSQINPIFALFWGTLVFADIFQPVTYIGVALIVVCALLLGWEQSPSVGQRVQMSRAVGYVLLGTFIRSIADLYLKIALTDLQYWDAFALSRLGTILPALLLLLSPSLRRQILQPFRVHGSRILTLTGVIEIFALINLSLLTLAFALGPLALVSATQSTLPLFVLGVTLLVNKVQPDIVPVRGSAWPRWGVGALSLGIVVGVYLLHLGSR